MAEEKKNRLIGGRNAELLRELTFGLPNRNLPDHLRIIPTRRGFENVELSLEKQYGEEEAYPRYYRFPQSENADVVASIWKITSAWDRDNLGKPVPGNFPGNTSVGGQIQHQNPERVANKAAALSKDIPAALVMIKAKELHVPAAKRALGLQGSANGAGFFATSARNHVKALRDDNNQNQSIGSQRTGWCPYDWLQDDRYRSGLHYAGALQVIYSPCK
ncbi:hypothetical protein FGB62_201g013 [Gracilaria domingensis]|nr:hypothetical protein FGB62_201g013 [Gracilaria domingensis]